MPRRRLALLLLAGLLLVWRRPGRSAALPLIVAALVAAFDAGIYFAAPGDPSQWIAWAGARTLMTPLAAALLAAMAPTGASAERPRT